MRKEGIKEGGREGRRYEEREKERGGVNKEGKKEGHTHRTKKIEGWQEGKASRRKSGRKEERPPFFPCS